MPTDPTAPQRLSPQRQHEIKQAVGRSQTAHESTVAEWYRLDVPALLGHVAALEQAQRYVPVAEALPTKFTEAGWSEAVQVCTDGRVNIFPHNYVPPKSGRPGYWLQVGEPHAVTNVTHWREFADDPAPAIAVARAGFQLDLQSPHHAPYVRP